MISIEDRAAFAKAEAKARQVRPHVSMIEFGRYSVASSQPDKAPYIVKFSKDTAGHWQAECECAAHVKSPKPRPCFHIVSAYNSHRIQADVRKQVRAAAEAAPDAEPVQPVCGCGSDAYAHFNGEWKCIDCVKKLAEQIAEAERLYPDLLAPIYAAASQGVTVSGVITTSVQEIESLIEQAKETSFEQDHDDVFGFIPARRERIKEEW